MGKIPFYLLNVHYLQNLEHEKLGMIEIFQWVQMNLFALRCKAKFYLNFIKTLFFPIVAYKKQILPFKQEYLRYIHSFPKYFFLIYKAGLQRKI